MRTIIALVFGLLLTGFAQVGLPTKALAAVGSSISADGSSPNDNAMLDVKSPTSGAGKGILIPRVSENQRTNANGTLDGGLLNSAGNLRGGPAQGLMVYQTDLAEGLYFNTSQTATPAWVYLGTSTTNYLPLTGGTMSGVLNMGGQIVSNTTHIDFDGSYVSVGREANGWSAGAAIGYQANGADQGVAVGWSATGTSFGVAVGRFANGTNYGAAVGSQANGANFGAAVGWLAYGYDYGAAMGRIADGLNEGVAVGNSANGRDYGVALGRYAEGTNYGAAAGASANGSDSGAALGSTANANYDGVAVGLSATGRYFGVAVGKLAFGTNFGVAVGRGASGVNRGAAVGYLADGNYDGVAVGYAANGALTNVAIGEGADAQGGTNHIAIGYSVINNLTNDTAVIRGTLYLDGGSTNIYSRATFGSGGWTVKAFEIDHPLDPENKILRHYCLESPQVWNVYAGNAQLVNGRAVVQLPDYYSALNLVGSEIYSLTPIGELALLAIGVEVDKNCFTIIGDKDIKVSWTIKVLRNDPGCREDLKRRPVEQMKKKGE